VLLVLTGLALSAAVPGERGLVRIDSFVVNGVQAPRIPARAAVDWCGVGQPPALDRKPDADLSSLRNVHVTYALPADVASRFSTLASAIATDTAAIEAWWRREDPSRAPRYDLFAFPGCTSKFGSLDIGFVTLPQNGIEYTGDSGADALLSDLPDIEALTSQKHVVYYDGPVPFGDQVCGTAFVPRSAPTQGGFSGIAFVWLQSLCGGDVGAGRLNAAVAVHELIHALGSLPGSSPNECLPPNDGHVCDSPTDVLYPEASAQTTLSTQILDSGRDDYYGHSGSSFDVQDSAWLSHLPQQRLAVSIQRTGPARGTVRLSSPVPFECTQNCSFQLDQGLSVTLIARPAAGSRFAGWKGACSGTAPCAVTLAAARNVTASFATGTFRLTVGVGGKGKVSSSPAGLTCPSRCSATFQATSNIRLRATAAPGFVFSGWTGSCRGKTACVVKLNGNRSVRATFKRRA
jgi:Divergent InlB B-repeat domain